MSDWAFTCHTGRRATRPSIWAPAGVVGSLCSSGRMVGKLDRAGAARPPKACLLVARDPPGRRFAEDARIAPRRIAPATQGMPGRAVRAAFVRQAFPAVAWRFESVCRPITLELALWAG